MTNLVLWTWAVGGTPLALSLIGMAMGHLRGEIVGIIAKAKDRRGVAAARWDSSAMVLAGPSRFGSSRHGWRAARPGKGA
jgi:hypothetical protein